MRRVVVTGMGAITPIGLSVDEFWNSVKENTVGIEQDLIQQIIRLSLQQR